MADDRDSDWETDEEIDVVVKLTGVIRDEFVKNMTSAPQPKCVALGLMTKEPLLQIGNDLFQGTYSHPIETHLLLRETQAEDGSNDMVYHCTTHKQLDMNKLYVQEKVQAQPDTSMSTDDTVTSTGTPGSPSTSMQVSPSEQLTDGQPSTSTDNGTGT